MIVLDLGCHNWGAVDGTSQEWLVAKFDPVIYWGFDPCLDEESVNVVDGRTYIRSRRAAWTHNGILQVHPGVSGTKVTEINEDYPPGDDTAICFDFPSFVGALPGPVIVKMDIEGAEYPILHEMIGREVMNRVHRWLIEWHGESLDFPHEVWDR